MRIYRNAGAWAIDEDKMKESLVLSEIKAILFRNLVRGESDGYKKSISVEQILIHPYYDHDKKIISLSIGIVLPESSSLLGLAKSIVDSDSLHEEIKQVVGVDPVINVARKQPYKEPKPKRPSKTTTPIDWKNIDWSKSTKDIADKLKLPMDFISDKRRDFSPETYKDIDWKHMDWSKRDMDISREFGVSPCVPSRYRRIFGPKKAANWYALYKEAKSITLYQGQSVHNKGSKYWTTDKEWARNFTQSGQDSEIKTININDASIYTHNPLPQATNPEEIDQVVAIAEQKGFNAIRVDEGVREPNSVLIFGAIAKPMKQREVDKWHKIWDKQEGK